MSQIKFFFADWWRVCYQRGYRHRLICIVIHTGNVYSQKCYRTASHENSKLYIKGDKKRTPPILKCSKSLTCRPWKVKHYYHNDLITWTSYIRHEDFLPYICPTFGLCKALTTVPSEIWNGMVLRALVED